ncbi:MAG: ABC transporter permease [Lachnospiraceae bacterium]|nr:ABC transporter permease [Lachnospiraceae bacterium]
MRVFKGYMILVKRNLGMILLYFAVFTFIATMIQHAVSGTSEDSFSLSSMKITVIDRDGGKLAEGLKDYLDVNNEIVDFSDDKDVLRDALYYRKTEYIIYIPEKFEETCLNGEEKLGITSVPGTYTESYVSYQIDSYLSQVETYEESGFTLEESIEKAIDLQNIRPEVTLQEGSNAQFADYMYSFRYFPYLFLAALCSSVGMLLVIFRKGEVKERIQSAPVPPSKRTFEMVLALAIVSLGLWVISMALPVIQSGGKVLIDDHFNYILINTLLLLCSSLGIAVIIGNLIKNAQIVTNIATTVSLGLCFLCGVFVPLDIMGENVKKVTQIFPVYWYEVINNLLGNYQTLTDNMKVTIYKGFGVQAAFAVACICVAMMISRMQEQKS